MCKKCVKCFWYGKTVKNEYVCDNPFLIDYLYFKKKELKHRRISKKDIKRLIKDDCDYFEDKNKVETRQGFSL